jgi:hypothetical protein
MELAVIIIVGIIGLITLVVALAVGSVAFRMASILYPIIIIAKLFGLINMTWMETIFSPFVILYEAVRLVFSIVF